MEKVKWKEYTGDLSDEMRYIIMANRAKVLKLDDCIEEEVFIEINNVQFITFVAYTPYEIKVNEVYNVNIYLFSDEINLKESFKKIKSLIQCKQGFQYTVMGYLDENGVLDVGFKIEDENFKDYSHLYGKYVKFFDEAGNH